MGSTRVSVGLRAMARPPIRPVVTIGMFDGVHLAHQQLIRTTIRLARRMQGTSVAITFDPDPRLVLDSAHPPSALMPLQERVRYLRALGIEQVWIIPFTKRFARVTAEQFVRRILIGRLRASALVVGDAFVFGRGRRGNMTMLRRLAGTAGMRIVAVPPIVRGGLPVSSSRIRALIAAGKLAKATRLLTRPPALYGMVVRGAGRGHRLGMPTANIRVMGQALPPIGVYAVRVSAPNGTRSWGGVMNLGVRPTFGPGPLVCEVHLLGLTGALRGRLLTVELLARLRSERCFANPDALRRQIHRDALRARRVLTRYP